MCMPAEQKQTRGRSPCGARFVNVLCCTLQAMQKKISLWVVLLFHRIRQKILCLCTFTSAPTHAGDGPIARLPQLDQLHNIHTHL